MMMFLSGVDDRFVRAEAPILGFGLLATPNRRHPSRWTHVPAYPFWAADSDCFNHPDEFDAARYIQWLLRLTPHANTCLFVTAPDSMADAAATWRQAAPVLDALRPMPFPRALVAQDGFPDAPVDWTMFEALFIGGTTSFKLSAHDLVARAKARGKLVHMGRVNSLRRLTAAQLMGCHSADGTLLRRRHKYLPLLARWLQTVNARQPLPLWSQP